MKLALIVALATLIVPATAETEPFSTSAPFPEPTVEPRLDLQLFDPEIGTPTLHNDVTPITGDGLGRMSMITPSSPGLAGTDRLVPPHLVIVIESPRGVHLIERRPVD